MVFDCKIYSMKEIYKNRIFKALIPFSYLYRALFFASFWSRKKGKIFSKESVFTVSVGNIHIGGTGKTPIEELLISKFIEMGFRDDEIILVSRGYKKKTIGDNIFYTKNDSPSEAGDETYMLMNKFSIKAISSHKRKKQLQTFFQNCEESKKVKIVVLDDAYQYVGINRDVNIAVVDVSMVNLRKHGKFTLPAVFLREPVSSLKRADAIVLTKNDLTQISEDNVQFIKEKFSNKKIFEANFTVAHVYSYYTKEKINIENKKVLVFSALSSNTNFFDSVSELGGIIVGQKSFADHHNYTQNDTENIFKKALSKGCSYVVTSEKDAAKFAMYIKQQRHKEMLAVAGLSVEADGLADYVLCEADKKLKKMESF